jgi:hypothetical protein
MRTVRRLRLRCFSFNIYSDVLSTLLLVALSNLGQAHQKHTIPSRALRGFFHLGQLYAYGGPAGNCPRVLNPFHLASSLSRFTTILYLHTSLCTNSITMPWLSITLRQK